MSEKLVEVARSFSYKLNRGNFQSADFFCSQKAEVPESEAEEKSEQLYEFCREEVRKSVNKFKGEEKEIKEDGKKSLIENELPEK
jgi:nucleoid-associated protein YejK